MKDLQYLRKVLCWIFAFSSLMYLLSHLWSILYTIHRVHALPTFSLRDELVLVVTITIFGMAWWTIWKEKSSARVWGIAASLIEILIFLFPFILHSSHARWHHLGALFIGIVGLIAFLRSDEIKSEADDSEPDENPS